MKRGCQPSEIASPSVGFRESAGWRGTDRQRGTAFAVVTAVVLLVVEFVLGWHRKLLLAIVFALLFLGVVVANWIRSRG